MDPQALPCPPPHPTAEWPSATDAPKHDEFQHPAGRGTGTDCGICCSAFAVATASSASVSCFLQAPADINNPRVEGRRAIAYLPKPQQTCSRSISRPSSCSKISTIIARARYRSRQWGSPSLPPWASRKGHGRGQDLVAPGALSYVSAVSSRMVLQRQSLVVGEHPHPLV